MYAFKVWIFVFPLWIITIEFDRNSIMKELNHITRVVHGKLMAQRPERPRAINFPYTTKYIILSGVYKVR